MEGRGFKTVTEGRVIFQQGASLGKSFSPQDVEYKLRSVMAEIGYAVLRYIYEPGPPVVVSVEVDKPESSTDFPEVRVRAILEVVDHASSTEG